MRRRGRTAPPILSSTCFSRAPPAAQRPSWRRRWTRWAGRSTPLPPKSVPASTHGCWTPICPAPRTFCATCFSTHGLTTPTWRPSGGSSWRKSACTRTTRKTCVPSGWPVWCSTAPRWPGPFWVGRPPWKRWTGPGCGTTSTPITARSASWWLWRAALPSLTWMT